MANNFLKGYTIEINGETTNFDKAMNQVTKSGQVLSKELSSLNKALKLDPTNVEKLSQKMDILKQKEANAKEQLKQYLDAQRAMEVSGYADKNSDDWHDLQARINEAEVQVQKYNKAIKETQTQMNNINADKLKKIADQAEKTGVAMTKYVTAPIVALGTASIMAFNAIDEGYDNIIKMTGATGDSAKELNDVFDDLYTSLPSDVETVSSAVGEANTLWHLQGEELKNLSDYYIKYSEITGQDVVSAMSDAYRIQQNWNLSLEDTNDLMGYVAKVSQDTGIEVGTLTGQLSDNVASFKEMGLTAEEAVTLMANFEKAGIDSTTMMTGLKKASTNYASAGLSMNEGLADLCDRLQDSSTYTDAYAEVVDMFGSKNALAFANLAKDGKISLEDLGVSLDEYGNVVEDTFDATLDPVDTAQTAWHSIQVTLADLGTTLQGVFAPILTTVSEKLKSFSEWFKNLDPNIKNTIVQVLGIVAVLGPLILIITKVSSGISNLMKGVGMLSNPITAVVLIIGLLAVAFVTLWNNSEAFRTKVTEIATTIQTTLQPIIQSVSDFITNEVIPVLQELWAFFQEYILPVLQVLAEIIIDVVITALQGMWEFFSTYILPILQQLWETFTTYILPVLEQFGAFISGVIVPVIQTLWSWFQQHLLPAIQVVANIVGGTLTIAFGVVNTAISVVCDIVSGFIKALEGVWTFLEDLGVIEAFGQAFQVVGDIIDSIVSAFQWIADNVMGIFNSIGEGISNVVGGLGDVISFLNPFDAGGYGDLIRQGGTMSMTTNITVNNNGSQISKAEIVRWGETITDVVDERLGRRIR